MPIVESTKPGSPLTQGDILKDITLFATKDGWLVNQSKSDLSAAELIVNQLLAQKASRTAQGKQFGEAELMNAETKLVELQKRVAPFEAELTRRRRPGQG